MNHNEENKVNTSEDDGSVDVNVVTGEVIEVRESIWRTLYGYVKKLLRFGAETKTVPTKENVEAIICDLKLQRKLMRVMFVLCLMAVIAVGHCVHPWLGLLIIVLYGAYFAAININGTNNELVRYEMLKGHINLSDISKQTNDVEPRPDGGNYL